MKKLFFAVLILGMIFSNASIYCFAEGNLIKNASFEQASGDLPDGWEKWMYVPDGSTIKVENGQGHDGNKFISIESKADNDARLKQAVPVKENGIYKLSCWAKTENVGDQRTGAMMSILDSTFTTKDLKGSNDSWQLLEMYARIGSGVSSIEVTVGLGGYGNMNTGKAFFDDLKVEEVSNAPEGIAVAEIGNSASSGDQSGSSDEKASGSKSLIIVLLVIAAAIIGGIAYFIFARRSRNVNEDEESVNDDGDDDDDEYVDDEQDDDSYTEDD